MALVRLSSGHWLFHVPVCHRRLSVALAFRLRLPRWLPQNRGGRPAGPGAGACCALRVVTCVGDAAVGASCTRLPGVDFLRGLVPRSGISGLGTHCQTAFRRDLTGVSAQLPEFGIILLRAVFISQAKRCLILFIFAFLFIYYFLPFAAFSHFPFKHFCFGKLFTSLAY